MTFLKYLAVQVLAYVIDMGVFLLIVGLLSINPIAINILSKAFAGIFAFIMQRKFTFKVPANYQRRKQAALYFLVLIINIPIASTALFLMLYLVSNAVLAKLLSDIICVGISYLLSKYFIFSKYPSALNSLGFLKG